MAGLLQRPLQAVVGQPIQLKVAQVFQDTDRVLRVRETGAEQRLGIVEADLDLIDMTKQVTDLVQAGTAAGQGLLEASLGRREAFPASGSPSPRGTHRGVKCIRLRHPTECSQGGLGVSEIASQIPSQ